MNKSEVKGQLSPILLTSTQNTAYQAILSSLENNHEGNNLTVLKGLSGVGKNVVLNQVERTFIYNDTQIVDADKSKYLPPGELFNSAHKLLTSSTLVRFSYSESIEQYVAKNYPRANVIPIILKGMNREETTTFVDNIPNITQTGLTKDQVIEYSLGIPLLVEQLAMPGVTESIAKKIVLRYLLNSFQYDQIEKEAKNYLQMPIPRTLFDFSEPLGLRGLGSERIYGDLLDVLNIQRVLRKKGIIEESPLFVDPQCEEIYDQMLNSKGISQLEIFIPNLTVEEFNQIQQSLGYCEWGRYEAFHGTRSNMFHAEYRKVSFLYTDPSGQKEVRANEFDVIEYQVKGYWNKYQKGELGLAVESNGPISFFAHSHEHNGLQRTPALLGWMLETFLQHKNIPYFVSNLSAGKSYFYKPEQRQIEIFPTIVKIDRDYDVNR
jgi:hypothetical protein